MNASNKGQKQSAAESIMFGRKEKMWTKKWKNKWWHLIDQQHPPSQYSQQVWEKKHICIKKQFSDASKS